MDYTKLKDFFNANDKFANSIGAKVVEIRDGYSRAEIELSPSNENSVGAMHGGAIFTLVDIVSGTAALSHGKVCTTLNANINYLKAVKSGKIIAEAEEIHNGRSTKIYEVRVKNENNVVVCIGTVTMFCTDKPYEF